jgi:polysaccharide biosynthesis transport protein
LIGVLSSAEQTTPLPSSLDLAPDPLQADSGPDFFAAGWISAAICGSRFLRTLTSSKCTTAVANKELAANVVNTLMNTYTENNFKSRFDSTMQASDWLSKQLVDLQMKVETSQEKLVHYQKEHEILGIDEKQNITTQKLDELNKELTAAESERMDRESVYRLVQAGDTDTIASAATALDAVGSTGQSASGLLETLRSKQAELKIQAAELNTQFGPSYPKLAQLNNQLKEIDAQILAETKKIAGKIRGHYMAALQRENMLHDALEKQKQEANKLNESAIEYSLLKRDLDTNRQLYEGLLEKLKAGGSFGWTPLQQFSHRR